MTRAMNEQYLGDGLFASFDGWQFCLRAPRQGGDHLVYLEPHVLASFIAYVRATTASAESANTVAANSDD
jgi:hypothetical protein